MVDVAALGYPVGAGSPRGPRNHRGLERLVAIGHNAPPTRREQPVNMFTPKMFTDSDGAKVVKNNAFQSSLLAPRFRLFLDRTVAARRPEKPAESTTEIIPGDRGMAGGSWCRPPLQIAQAIRQADITSSSGRSRVRSVHTNQELSGKVRLETASEPSQARGKFRPVRRTQLPRGYWLLLRRPERRRVFRWADPTKRPSRSHEWARKGDRTAGSERAWQSSSTSSIEAA